VIKDKLQLAHTNDVLPRVAVSFLQSVSRLLAREVLEVEPVLARSAIVARFFHRSDCSERQQLWWLPLPAFSMTSWAAKLYQAQPTAAPEPDQSLADKRIAVVDANAIISMGTDVRSLGDVIITTEEVVAEIKDAATRQALPQIPFVFRPPSSDALKAVSAFAKRTGDLFQLSLEDLRLLAVTLTLEEQQHGTDHLRTAPAPVRAHAKQTTAATLPGWGNTTSDEWSAIDAVKDNGAHSQPAGCSCGRLCARSICGVVGMCGRIQGCISWKISPLQRHMFCNWSLAPAETVTTAQPRTASEVSQGSQAVMAAPTALASITLPGTDGWVEVKVSRNATRRAIRKVCPLVCICLHGQMLTTEIRDARELRVFSKSSAACSRYMSRMFKALPCHGMVNCAGLPASRAPGGARFSSRGRAC
jgi:PIN domain of ribonuclease